MPQSFTNLLYHLISGTKHRQPWLTEEFRARVHAYIGGIVRNLGGIALEINGFNEHFHALVRLPPTICVADAMGIIKANSSKWIHATFPALAAFAWQNGYTALSVSESGVPELRAYIQRQVEHHRAASYEDEMRKIYVLHGLDPDTWNDE